MEVMCSNRAPPPAGRVLGTVPVVEQACVCIERGMLLLFQFWCHVDGECSARRETSFEL